jgi:hypothetical protein
MQFVADVQTIGAAASSGAPWTAVQAEPFHMSTLPVPAPEVMQETDEAQETSGPSAEVVAVQPPVPHIDAAVSPTATQKADETHETAVALVSPVSSADDHAVPFQVQACPSPPTTTQKSDETHEIPTTEVDVVAQS